MKKASLLHVVLILSASSFSQGLKHSQFVLSGKVHNSNYSSIYLLYTDKDGNSIKDSCTISRDSFSFKGHITEPTFAVIRNSGFMADDENLNINNLFLEPANMTLTTEYNDFKKMQVTGSKNNLELDSLKTAWEKVNRHSDSVREIFNKIDIEFISSHPGSYVSAYLLNFSKRTWPVLKVKSLFDNFSEGVKTSFFGKEIDSAIKQVTENSAGKKAKEFETKDINGKTINLSQFKGSYVLLDFWASWCGPCRETTPHLIELFKKYHTMGLNVVGVSVDENSEDWKTAVKKDSAGIWHNILSRQSGNTVTKNEMASINALYGVFVYPTKILIDKNGVIKGRYTGTEDDTALTQMITSLFN